MPILAILTIGLQIICGIHAVRTNQDMIWIRLLLFPGVGLVIYALGVLVPTFLNSFTGRKTIETVQNKVAPGRNLKTLRRDLALSDNTKNRIDLGDELARLDQYDEAIEHYRAGMVGIYKDDAELLTKLATAQFYNGDFRDAKRLMEQLIDLNSGFKKENQEAHLVYIRSLEKLDELTLADEEYQKLIKYYTGPEARFCYARYLVNQSRSNDAKALLEEILEYSKIATKGYKRRYKPILNEINRLYLQL